MVESELFDKQCGNVYLIPYDSEMFILSQVGFGGDLGVFEGLYDRGVTLDTISPPLMFRVSYGLVSPIKYAWVSKGLHIYKAKLGELQPYFYKPIGSTLCSLVYLDGHQEEIDCLRAHEFEALATWSHEHIISRFSHHDPARIEGHNI